MSRLAKVTATCACLLGAAAVSACSGNFAADEGDERPVARPNRRADPEDRLFGRELSLGPGGLNSDSFLEGSLSGEGGAGRMPVNRFLWQASLDTLSFLPLASTDPFTGVIATEWAAAPGAPNERLKVTVFMTRAALEASSLNVAVYREALTEDGLWVPQPVSAETVRRLEDAILTRARQIRIAAREAGAEAS